MPGPKRTLTGGHRRSASHAGGHRRRGHGNLLCRLYDWRFETLALMAPSRILSQFESTVIPSACRASNRPSGRLASGRRTHSGRSGFSPSLSPYCALPCRTRALSCPRENPAIRQRTALELGVSQISAGSRTNQVAMGIQPVSRRHNFPASVTAPRGSDCRSRTAQIHSLFSAQAVIVSGMPAKISWTTQRNRASSRKMRAQRSVHL